MTEVMAAIADASTALVGFVGTAVAAGIAVGVVGYGARRAWGAFKSVR
jgi:hypothetical protein